MDNDLSDVLGPIAIIGSFSVGIYLFTLTMTNYILRKKMIEKGFVSDEAQNILKTHTDQNKYSSLKWGLIALFSGLGLILMEYIPVSPNSPLPYGLFAVSVSLGFLIYYFLIRREQK